MLLLFLWYFFWRLLLYKLSFLCVLKNVTLCSMNVCVLIYLWFAKTMIWSMLQVLSWRTRRNKRAIARILLCEGTRCIYFGGVRGLIARRLWRRYFLCDGTIAPSPLVHTLVSSLSLRFGISFASPSFGLIKGIWPEVSQRGEPHPSPGLEVWSGPRS